MKRPDLPKMVLIALLVLTIFACGPSTYTSYQFVPPSDPNVRACIHQCQTMKVQCIHIANLEASNSAAQMKQDYYECQRRKASLTGMAKAMHTCVDMSGFAYVNDTSNCDNEYRNCYIRCGGVIKTVTYTE